MIKKFLHKTTAVNSLETATRSAAVNKLLYPTREAKAVIGCGTTTLYALINGGMLEARKLGHRTYITVESVEAFVASLPPVVTPTMARAEHERWSASAQRRPRAKPQEDEPGAAE